MGESERGEWDGVESDVDAAGKMEWELDAMERERARPIGRAVGGGCRRGSRDDGGADRRGGGHPGHT
jgi:hypothetical protein